MKTSKEGVEIGVFIDPRNCGSSIQGFVLNPEIQKDDHFDNRWWLDTSATLRLSDCNRSIEWDFSNRDRGVAKKYNIDKIDKVINTLMEFRHAMVEANVLIEELDKEVKEHNENVRKDKKLDD